MKRDKIEVNDRQVAVCMYMYVVPMTVFCLFIVSMYVCVCMYM